MNEVLGREGELADGVKVIHRTDGNFCEVSAEMCATIRTMLDMTAKERTAARNNAARLADKAQWKNFIKYYYEAYDFALGR